MKDVIFRGKPKRMFLSRDNVDEVGFPDPKRVHQCLREFNDMSANSVFQSMLEQIVQLEKDQAKSGGSALGFSSIGGKNITRRTSVMGKGAGAMSPEDAAKAEEEASTADIIANVERMLAAERKAAGEISKSKHLTTFNMNEGVLGTMGSGGGAGDTAGEAGSGDLDVDIQKISRKKLDVKADNVTSIFAENIDTIAEQVQHFEQMDEQIVRNDPVLMYQKQKEQYEEEISELE